MRKTFILMSLAIGVISCNQHANNPDPIEETVETNSFNEEQHHDIYINESGELRVNGMVKSLAELDLMLEALKNENGVVHYFRSEAYQGGIWEDALDLVTKYELPLAFYTDETFTEKVQF